MSWSLVRSVPADCLAYALVESAACYFAIGIWILHTTGTNELPSPAFEIAVSLWVASAFALALRVESGAVDHLFGGDLLGPEVPENPLDVLDEDDK